MAKIYAFLFILIGGALLYFGLSQSKTPEQTVNLVPNPTLQGSFFKHQPVSWHQSTWGNHGSQFLSDTQSNNSSLTVQVANYQDGDAKWYFEPVTILPAAHYEWSDTYQSTTDSWLVAEFIDPSGKITYQDLGSAPQSNNWRSVQVAFDTPAVVSKMSVFHLLKSNGRLTTKDFDLEHIGNTTDNSLIPNPSFEVTDPKQIDAPQSWTYTNQDNVAFSYAKTGYIGKHSGKVETASADLGQPVGWVHPQVFVNPGQSYQFSDYYQATVTTDVTVSIVNNDDSKTSLTLKPAPASSDWAYYFTTFTLPPTAKTITVVHGLKQVGSLTTDDYNLQPAVHGFDHARVTLAFDDNWGSVYTNAFPLMQKYHMVSTQYVLTGSIGQKSYMTARQLKNMQKAGHQLAVHTVHHPDLTKVSTNQIDAELIQSKQDLQKKFGITTSDFTSPFGSYNQTTIEEIKKYYATHRTTDDGFITKDNFEPYKLVVQNVTVQTTPEEFNSWLDYAQANNAWLILVYHQVDTDEQIYSVRPNAFEAQLQSIQKYHIPVETLDSVLAQINPQLQK